MPARSLRTARGRVLSGLSTSLTPLGLPSTPPTKENRDNAVSSPNKLLRLRKNPLAREVCKRMYTNKEKTGDIKFKIGNEEISAHKCVLAALSPKYEAQFYGEFDDTTCNVVEVKEVTATAFKEFLQFFYLNEFLLTHANIEHVLSLSEASLVEEFVDECMHFLIETLSVENVCHTYYLAMKHECEELIESCEREISLHSDEVFASKDFISTGREVVFNILQLDSLNCKETDVFNACIEWAKHFCTENQSDPENKKNLRAALNPVPDTSTTVLQPINLLYQIRCGAMSIEEFMVCYKSYKDIFTEDEREEILYMIGKVNDKAPKWFSNEIRGIPYMKWDEKKKIECNRIFSETSLPSFRFGTDLVSFSCNKPMLLGGFYCGSLFESVDNSIDSKRVSANVNIVRKHTSKDFNGKTMFNSVEELIFRMKQEALVKLQRPVFIKPNFVYEIQIDLKQGISLKSYEFKKVVGMDGGALVVYHDEIQKSQGIVTCLILNGYDEDKIDVKDKILTQPSISSVGTQSTHLFGVQL